MNEAVSSSGLRFLTRSKVTQFPPRVAEAMHCNSSEDVNIYVENCASAHFWAKNTSTVRAKPLDFQVSI